MKDSVQKGRRPKGDKHWSKIKPECKAWGDKNGSRTKPEQVARGKRHGSYTKPHTRPYGEKNRGSKLTEKQVLKIRKRYKKKELTQVELANEYRVDAITIWRVVNYKTWKHLP